MDSIPGWASSAVVHPAMPELYRWCEETQTEYAYILQTLPSGWMSSLGGLCRCSALMQMLPAVSLPLLIENRKCRMPHAQAIASRAARTKYTCIMNALQGRQ